MEPLALLVHINVQLDLKAPSLVYKEIPLYNIFIPLYHMHFEYMVRAGNFGQKLQATFLDAPYKYMY